MSVLGHRVRTLCQGVRSCRRLVINSAANMSVNVGDSLPNVDLFENDPGSKVNTQDTFGSGKHIIFGVPGAFTPGCSKTHLPGYIENASKLKEKGILTINCVSVNDPFVMQAWGEVQGAEGKVRMLADTCGAFSKAMGLELDAAAVLGNVRCKRFSMVVNDGKIEDLSVEPSGTGLTCSLASAMINKV